MYTSNTKSRATWIWQRECLLSIRAWTDTRSANLCAHFDALAIEWAVSPCPSRRMDFLFGTCIRGGRSVFASFESRVSSTTDSYTPARAVHDTWHATRVSRVQSTDLNSTVLWQSTRLLTAPFAICMAQRNAISWGFGDRREKSADESIRAQQRTVEKGEEMKQVTGSGNIRGQEWTFQSKKALQWDGNVVENGRSYGVVRISRIGPLNLWCEFKRRTKM